MPDTVKGFRSGQPNAALVQYAQSLLAGRPHAMALDIGCGAGRNTVPLAHMGYHVHGIDLSAAMIGAARDRARAEGAARCLLSLASMTALPIRGEALDLVVAHGIWNLATRDDELRMAMAEAARVAKAGARLFVYTFARASLPASTQPVAGQQYVFRGSTGAEQCFLTSEQLVAELARTGFVPDLTLPPVEHNAPGPGAVQLTNSPVFLEAAFIRQR